MRWRASRWLVFALSAALLLVSAPVALADSADDQFLVAATHYREQRWKLAASEFDLYLTRFPQHSEAARATFFRAEVAVQQNDFPAARRFYADYLRLAPEGRFASQALFRSGEIAYFATDRAAARVALERFVDAYPDIALTPHALNYLGELALAEQDWASAKKLFGQAIEEFPQAPLIDRSRLGYARAFQGLGQLDKATTILRRVTESRLPEQALAAQWQLAGLDYDAQRYAEALQLYNKLTKSTATAQTSAAELGRAQCMYQLGNPAEAKPILTKLITNATMSADARYWLGLVEQRLGNETVARQIWVELITKSPKHAIAPRARNLLAESWLESAQAERALGSLALLQLDQKSPDYLRGECLRALARQMQGKHTEAIAIVTSALEIAKNADRAPLLQTQATSQLALHDAKAAVASLTEAAAVSTDTKLKQAVLIQLALALAKNDQLSESLAHLTTATKLDPTHDGLAGASEQIARLAYQAGKYDIARQCFALLAASPDSKTSAVGLLGVAWCQISLEQSPEAIATLQQLLDRHAAQKLSIEAAMLLGQTLDAAGDASHALDAYNWIVDHHPKSIQAPQALLSAARMADKSKNYDRSNTLYARLVTDYPQVAELDAAYYGWAWSRRDARDSKRSAELFTLLHEKYPTSQYWGDSTYRLAELAAEQNRMADARRLLDQIMAGNATVVSKQYAMFLRGQLLVLDSNWGAAEKVLKKLIANRPPAALRLQAEYWLAESVFRQERHVEAAKLFDELMARVADNPEDWSAMVLLRRAQIHAHERQWSEALTITLRMPQRYPKFNMQYEADYLIGRCYIGQAEFDKARAAFDRVLQSPVGGKTETAAMAQWMLGESYFHQQKFEDALSAYLRLEILHPYPHWQAAALLQAGKCQENLGNFGDAATLYRTLIEKYPKSELVGEAKQRTADLGKRNLKPSVASHRDTTTQPTTKTK